MASKIINQEGTECDVPNCNKFYVGEKPKSWKHVKFFEPGETAGPTTMTADLDACSAKHAKEIQSYYAQIS